MMPPSPPTRSAVSGTSTPADGHRKSVPRAPPPVVRPKPAGYRTYDALDDNEEQVYLHILITFVVHHLADSYKF